MCIYFGLTNLSPHLPLLPLPLPSLPPSPSIPPSALHLYILIISTSLSPSLPLPLFPSPSLSLSPSLPLSLSSSLLPLHVFLLSVSLAVVRMKNDVNWRAKVKSTAHAGIGNSGQQLSLEDVVRGDRRGCIRVCN